MTGSERRFRVASIFHPTLHVPSLDEAEEFYGRVLGRSSTNIGTVMTVPPAPGHSTDYSTYTMVGDVLLDSLEPRRYLTQNTQRHPDVDSARLDSLGWYVDGVRELYRSLRAAGFRVVDSRDEILDAEEWGGGPSPFYALAEDAGLRYHFFETFPFPLDPRSDSDRSEAEPLAHDPLGIVRASHHTVLTRRPDRALRLLVDVLGGSVIAEGRDELRRCSGPYVHLADAVFHLAEADDSGTGDAEADGSAPAGADGTDRYQAITWQVRDLDRVAAHLGAHSVDIAARSDTALVTDPATSLGIPWGFTTDPIPGDPR